MTLWRKTNFNQAGVIFRTGSSSQSSVAVLLSAGHLLVRLKMNCEHDNSVTSCITCSRQVCFWYFHEFSFPRLFNLVFLIYFLALH